MQRLNPNERRLLLLFASTCVLVLAVLGVKALGATRKNLQARMEDLHRQYEENAQWIAEKPVWEARAKWLAEHPAPKADVQGVASDMLSHLQGTLAEKGAKILEQEFSPPGHEGRYDTVNVRLKISGAFGNVAKWLFEVQQPKSYLGIKKISFKGDGEPPQISCEVEITQFLQNE